MRLTVSHGTGKKADVEAYLVGGKTGSADKPKNGRYDHNSILSSFIGVFPMDAPRYAVFVMFDEPKGTKATGGFATGGIVSAPAVAEIITRSAPLLGVMPVNDKSYRIQKEFYYEPKTYDLPDVELERTAG
jgi:cell division protein FtsI (penicillin-binding protein 3)